MTERLVLARRVALALAVAVLVAPTWARAAASWSTSPQAEHGPWAALAAVVLLVLRRREVQAGPRRPRPWPGLALLTASGWLLLTARADGFLGLEAPCAALLVTGALLVEAGVPRRAWVCLALLALVGPLPFGGALLLSLKDLATALACACLDLAGVPVARAGNLLQLEGARVEMATACSGLTGLTTFCLLAAVQGSLRGWGWRAAAVLAAAVPLAIVMNTLRVLLLCWLAVRGRAEDPVWHEGAGLLTYSAGLLLLLGLDALLRRGAPAAPSSETPAEPTPEPAPGRLAGALAACALALAVGAAALSLLGPGRTAHPWARPSGAPTPRVTDAITLQAHGWAGTRLPVPPPVVRELGTDDIAAVRYARGDQARPVDLYLVHAPDDPWRAYHPPEMCFLGSGWRLTRDGRRAARLGAREVEVNVRCFEREAEQVLVWYWYRVDDQEVTGGHAFRLRSLLARLSSLDRPRGALIRLSTPSEGPAAEARLEAFVGEALSPILRVLNPQG